jgi:diguanylate cyclase (GGDEF)-like protein
VKLGIAVKLGALLALVGFIASGLTGFYAYNASRDLLIQSAKSELRSAAEAVIVRVSNVRTEVSRNLTVLATHPATLAALEESGSAQKDQLATLFTLMMKVNPSYFQIRLISITDFGMERVRIDLDDTRWVRVEGDDLQEKMHYPYVYDTLKIPIGATYLSAIVINHERGAHAGLDKPTVQLATPVHDARGRAVGVIVINVDLNATFKQLAASLPENAQLYLVNRMGDYLIHPDSSQAFGFDTGRRVLVQNEFPETANLVSGKINHVVLESHTGQHQNSPLVASFVRQPVTVQSDETSLILGLAEPLETVLRQADQMKATTLKIVLGFFLSSVLLAALVAQAITQPINAMGKAAQQYAQGIPMADLPTQRKDEIGVLARSFKRMHEQIDAQISELEERKSALEHLALHDVLTGLPNRRLFQERLEQAVERARRSGERFALLFIDLDDFKEINDRLTHDAGDAALKSVALRLTAAIRKVDTVARLGGDEFVVLLSSPIQRDQVIAVAEKLLAGNQLPIPFGEHALRVNFSIGVSQYPEDGLTAGEILSNADHAMYLAKAKGDHGLHFSSETSTFPSPLS